MSALQFVSGAAISRDQDYFCLSEFIRRVVLRRRSKILSRAYNRSFSEQLDTD